MTDSDVDILSARAGAIAGMKELIGQPFLILDTESTGLDDIAEIVQIAVIDHEGNVLLDTLIKPSTAINESGRAYEVNGIGNKMVADAPTFDEVLPKLLAIIANKVVAIYNAPFDTRIIAQSQKSLTEKPYHDGVTFIDIMMPYAEYVGDWNDYYGNFRWQRLPGGGHTALSDCLATLKLINKMAATNG